MKNTHAPGVSRDWPSVAGETALRSGFRQPDRLESGRTGEGGLLCVEGGEMLDCADGADRDMQQVKGAAHLPEGEPAGKALSLGENGLPGDNLSQQFAGDPVMLKDGQAAGQVGFTEFTPGDFLAEAISEFEFLKLVEQNGLALLLNKGPRLRAERLGQVEGNQEAGVVIDSHRRPSMMTWLPGFPGAGLPPKMESTLDHVSFQSTGVAPRLTGTILATGRFRRMTRIS